VLGVSSDATTAQLKKAYHKLALLHHPDKVSSKDDAEEIAAAKLKFQAISVTYQILSDEERRKEYDHSGELIDVDNEDFVSSSSFAQWDQFFKNLFPGIKLDDIDKFTVKYKESDEEKMDVLKYYNICRGDLNKMVNCVMCSDKSDKKRWMKQYIEPAIRRGDIPRFHEALEKSLDADENDEDEDAEYDDLMDLENESSSGNTNDKNKRSTTKKGPSKASPIKKSATKTKKKSKLSKEAEEKMAEALIAQIRGKNSNGSSSLLTKRAEAFDSLISQMENKYSKGSTDKKKGGNNSKPKHKTAEIPDDEFEKIQARLIANRSSNKRKS